MTAQGQPSGADQPGRFRRAVRAFRRWRRARPFWGGLLVLLGGLEILASERAPLPLVIHIGLQGLAGYLVPVLLVLVGVLLLFHPVQRLFYSLLAIVLALGSWITSNLGGFFAGLLLALIGGALAFAWQRDRRQPAGPHAVPPRTGSDPDKETPPEVERPESGHQPKHARTAGLELVRGAQAGRADHDERGAGSEPGNSALLAVPLAPLAMTVLAAVGSRGLLTGSVPLVPVVPAAASPSVSPLPGPPVPSPRPSPDPSPGSGSRPPHRPHHAARGPAMAVAADPFQLTARFAALTGLTYDGVANVPTAHGTQPMLKFTMTSLRLPGAALAVSQEGAGSFRTADSSLEISGDVALYTTRLSGAMQGVKVTFTVARPPAALPANLTLTGVTAEQPFAAGNVMRASRSQLTTG